MFTFIIITKHVNFTVVSTNIGCDFQFRNEVSKLDERLRVTEDHLKQKVHLYQIYGTSVSWKLEPNVHVFQNPFACRI